MSKSTQPSGTPRPSGSTSTQPSKAVSNEAVSKLAYEKFAARSYVHGFDQEDWAQAERELSSRSAAKP